MMMKPPKRMCQQTITLTLTDPTKTDEWGQPLAGKPVTIEHCVVQPQTIYSGSNNDRTIVANAVVFLYAGISSPIPTIAKHNIGSKLVFEGEEYTVQKIIDNREPFSNDRYSYELEVL
ncbi:capsid protein [Lactiplantibacillus plantarum WHE 92]|nr:capsid protein [Lactiplantibacillus plantarum WHE 92]